MTIAEAREKGKSLIGRIPRDILVIAVLILASSASFGLGYLAGRDTGVGAPVPTLTGALESIDAVTATATSAVGRVVAAKGGTKYYLPTCAGADRISEANKVWFVSIAAADAAGYSPATNCKGL